MLSLFFAILSSAAIALLFRATEGRDYDRTCVAASNYLLAALIAVVSLALQAPPAGWTEWGSAAAEWSAWRAGDAARLGPASSAIWGSAIGLAGGGIFFISFVTYQRGIRIAGAPMAGAFMKLGIFVPLILSLVIWRAMPSGTEIAALALAAVALLVAHAPIGGGPVRGRGVLMLICLLGGLAEFTHKIFEFAAMNELTDVFLVSIFSTALIASTAAMWRRKRWPTRAELLAGCAVGVPNLLSSRFLLAALERLPAPLAFALFGAGTIAVIAIGNVVIYKERLTRREIAALVFVAAAVVVAALG